MTKMAKIIAGLLVVACTFGLGWMLSLGEDVTVTHTDPEVAKTVATIAQSLERLHIDWKDVNTQWTKGDVNFDGVVDLWDILNAGNELRRRWALDYDGNGEFNAEDIRKMADDAYLMGTLYPSKPDSAQAKAP